MSIFLKKVRAKTVFSLFEPIIVEPLELCYLQTVTNEMEIDSYIVDDLLGLEEPKEIIPKVVVLTGYHTAEDLILKEALSYKKKFPSVVVIVGGIHIEKNRTSFHHTDIDYVIHTQDLAVFKALLGYIYGRTGEFPSSGVDYRELNGEETPKWKLGNILNVSKQTGVMPDRSLFNRIRHKTRYLDKRDVALIKSSVGCPYQCDFCYCKLVNSGIHVKGSYDRVLKEILEVDAKHHWIVDDVFLSSRQDALDYIKAYHRMERNTGRYLHNGPYQLIIYSRADFILRNSDLLDELKACGIAEVIIGFEATSKDELDEYNKQTDSTDYPRVIELLRGSGIDLTALFMVQPDYGIKDFGRLHRFITLNGIETYTISILTPIKGTKNFTLMENSLTTKNPAKFDFLHLVLPSRLPKPLFYLLFYGLHLRLLKSKRVWKYIRQSLFSGRVQDSQMAGEGIDPDGNQ
jgi:radical SAM superfamily enzyme YgiQ (UPF0313 family)